MSADNVPPSLNASFRDRFRDQPEDAQVTLHAQARVGDGGTCKIEREIRGAEAGLHPAVGGDGSKACAGDILLESLVSCAGVTLSQMAAAMEIELRKAVIRAEGDLDFRGSLALSDDVPVGLHSIRLHLDVDSDATDEQLAMLVRLTERYCVVAQTLQPVTAVTYASTAKG